MRGSPRAVLSMLALVASAGISMIAPVTARAGDIEDYQEARAAYDAHDWPRAVLDFEALVGSDPPVMRTSLLVLESRKYLAAAYVFVGRPDAARAQLQRLLVSAPDYELDAAQFPIELVEIFQLVRAEVQEERAHAAERAEARQILEAERERSRQLIAFAESEVTLEIENSRWVALVPFGAGQFQNGQDDLGWMFFVTQSITGLGAFAAFAVHQNVQSQLTNEDALRRINFPEVNAALLATEIVNWACIGLFSVFAIVGVVQAEVEYRSTRTVHARRTVPAPLRDGLEVRLSPAGLSLVF